MLVAAAAAAAGATGEPVRVDFFHAHGCDECVVVRSRVLPEIDARFGARVAVREYDVDVLSNYVRFVTLCDRLGIPPTTGDRVAMILDERAYVGGESAIRTRLAAAIEARLAARDAEGTAAGAPPPPPSRSPPENLATLAAWAERHLTLPLILGLGLADGLNPCAFTTVVFLMSVLAVSGIRGRRLLLAASSYAVGSYVAYFGLGLGLFGGLRALPVYGLAGRAVGWIVAGLLLGVAGLSARDAVRFARTHRSESVTLQLPAGVKQRLHRWLRTGVSPVHLVSSGAVLGMVATLLGSVCTGLVYVPLLVYLTRHPELGARAWGLLALYNAMAVVPLLVVTAAAYAGATTPRLMAWSARHVAASKWLLAGLCLLLAAALCLR